jgi:anti-anti-sigma regulatory factor
MEIVPSFVDGLIRLQLSGPMGHDDSVEFGYILEGVVERPAVPVLVDLQHLETLQDDAAGQLGMFANKWAAKGGKIVIYAASPKVSAVFRKMALHEILTIKSNESEALNELGPPWAEID